MIVQSRRIAPRLVPTQRGQRELVEEAVRSRDYEAQALEELERDVLVNSSLLPRASVWRTWQHFHNL